MDRRAQNARKKGQTLRNDRDAEGHLLSCVTLKDSFLIPSFRAMGLKSLRILSFRYQQKDPASETAKAFRSSFSYKQCSKKQRHK